MFELEHGMNILITGACGFLARELIRVLEECGHHLRLVDRVDPDTATVFIPGAHERAVLPLRTQWPIIKAEITDLEAMRGAMDGVEAVIHLAAAVSGVPDRGIETMHANVIGTYVVLDAARQVGVHRVLCASSINAFGTFYWRISQRPVVYPFLPLDETFTPEPEDPYSLSKYVNEETCAAFTRAYGLTTAAFRFGGVWSPQQYQAAVSKALPATTVWSNDLFHWVHVKDIAQGVFRALESDSLPPFGVYTLSAADTRCPEPTHELVSRFQPHLVDTLTPPLVGRAALVSIERARQTFGYDPQYRLGP